MTDDLDSLPFRYPSEPTVNVPTAVKRHVHRYSRTTGICDMCPRIRDEAVARRNKNNRQRGNAEELTVARRVGGRKVGPLGHPWDVEMPGYARLQVRKYKTPQSLHKIDAELTRIGYGQEMPGYVWIQPGRDGARLIVFDLDAYADRHGVDIDKEAS